MRGFCTPQALHNVTLATHGNEAPQSLQLRNRTAAVCVLETGADPASADGLVALDAGGVGVDSARRASVTAGGCADVALAGADVALVAPGAGGVGVDSALSASVTADGCADVALAVDSALRLSRPASAMANDEPGEIKVPKDEREGFGLAVGAAGVVDIDAGVYVTASLREAPGARCGGENGNRGALTDTLRTSKKNSLPSLTTIS